QEAVMQPSQRITLDEFLKLEEVKPYNEYIDGYVVQKKGGETGHAMLQTYLMVTLGEFVKEHGIGTVLPEVHCIIGASGAEWSLCPDISVFVGDNFTRLRDEDEPYPKRAPDLVVDILSPDEPASVLVARTQFLLRH